MGTLTTWIGGAGQQLTGRIKTLTGKLLNDPEMKLKGRATEFAAMAKQTVAKTYGWTRGKVQALAGIAMRKTGAATDSPDVEASGVAKQIEGEATQTVLS